MKIKKDKYFRERGGKARLIKVICSNCEKLIFLYQKDGPGHLKRCYLNRIIEPKEYALLNKNPNIKEPKDIRNIICRCGNIIGSPIIYQDGRLAFHLIRNNFRRELE